MVNTESDLSESVRALNYDPTRVDEIMLFAATHMAKQIDEMAKF